MQRIIEMAMKKSKMATKKKMAYGKKTSKMMSAGENVRPTTRPGKKWLMGR
jgi:hypothetical protein